VPIRKVEGGYKWGGHGHVYATRAGAERQAAAAHAHGFKGDEVAKRQARGERVSGRDLAKVKS
jgi:hypothetical protein